MTWLRLRPGWLYLLRLSESRPTTIPTQWWRDILYGPTGRDLGGSTTLNAQRAHSLKQVFGRAFGDSNLDAAAVGPVRWFHQRIKQISPQVARMIIWEMHDLGFRYELLALDHLLVPHREGGAFEEERDDLLGQVFPARTLYSVPVLPDQDASMYELGMYVRDIPHHHVYSLEAFRQVLLHWPRCPPSLHRSPISIDMTAEQIVALETEMIKFYVNIFFEQSGRAPIVPHRIPLH